MLEMADSHERNPYYIYFEKKFEPQLLTWNAKPELKK